MEVESDAESNSALVIDELAEETSKESVTTGQAEQSGRADTGAVQLPKDGEASTDVVEDEEMKNEEGAELSAPTSEKQSVMAVVSSLTPTPISIYSTVLSSSQVHPAPTPTLSTITNCNAIFQNRAILLYGMSQ